MPEYLSPGVYVEEIDAGPKPIEGVSTSTVGAVGVTVRGPTKGKPVLVTSFAEFTRKFGGFLPEPESATRINWADNETNGGRWWHFPLTVKGFFDNGGQRLYVKRVFSGTATASTGILGQGLVSEVLDDAAAGATGLHVRHVIDIQNNSTVQIIRGDNGNAIAHAGGTDFTVTSYDTKSGRIVLNPGLSERVSVKRGDFIQIHPRSASPLSTAATTIAFQAKSRGVWGEDLSIRVSPVVGSSYKILPSAVVGGSVARTTIAAPAITGISTIEVANVAGFGNGDRVLIDTREYVLSNVLADPTTTVATTAAAAGDTTITVASVAGLANGNRVDIGGDTYILSNVTAAADTFDITPAVPAGPGWPIGTEVRLLPRTLDISPAVPAGATWPAGTSIQRLRPANDTAVPARTIGVWGASNLYVGAIVELDNGTQKEAGVVSDITDDIVTLSVNLTQSYFEGHILRVIEASVSVRYAPKDDVPIEETFPSLRLVDDGSLNYLPNHVSAKSAFVEVLSTGMGFSASDLSSFPCATGGGWQGFGGGDDDPVSLSVDDFVGADNGSGNRTGIQALEDIDEVSICLAPGIWSSTVHSALIQHCEILKDRFALLDPKDRLSIEGIRTMRETLDTKYAALYYPWIEVRDPSVKRDVVIAPSGHMAGIYARVDVERGVHKAPANEVIRGISKIADDVCKREQDMLNPKGINALRFFPGRGNRVWGARTLSSDASWKYINVRRLFIFVEESIDEGTQWVVFEPNDEPLWARVRQTIENFLTTVWRSGALEGAKPNEAFFVKCDRTTMTQDDIDNGRLICHIGIAPVKPAEFVIFRIQQKTRDNLNS